MSACMPEDLEHVRIKPDHYAGAVDPIALMESAFTSTMLMGFYAGNVLKYVARHPRRDDLRDLEKAQDYLERLIDLKQREVDYLLATTGGVK